MTGVMDMRIHSSRSRKSLVAWSTSVTPKEGCREGAEKLFDFCKMARTCDAKSSQEPQESISVEI